MHTYTFELTTVLSGGPQRLDKYLADQLSDYSRSQVQKAITTKDVTVNNIVISNNKHKLYGGEIIAGSINIAEDTQHLAQDIPLDIVHEDEHLLLINKPVGLVVHPGSGNPDGTLLNGLLHYNENQASLSRAGIVHRLDKDTSGIMVVAKTVACQTALVELLSQRLIHRHYKALVNASVVSGGSIEGNIGRSQRDRKKMAILQVGGKHAVTHYRVEQRFSRHSLLDVSLETGRTHQIRVHLSHKNMAIVGDRVYGGRQRIPAGLEASEALLFQQCKRQMLHAYRLQFTHPISGDNIDKKVPMPDDMLLLLDILHTYDPLSSDPAAYVWEDFDLEDDSECEVIYADDDMLLEEQK